MQARKIVLSLFVAALTLGACQGGHDASDDNGTSTPIDSTNQNGTAPAVYGGDNPANDQDTTYRNSSDTGTRISNGPDRANNVNSTNNQNQ